MCMRAQNFRPVTVECPKVLLPLVNARMIDYTLEWLVAGGVEEVCTMQACCAHACAHAWCMCTTRKP